MEYIAERLIEENFENQEKSGYSLMSQTIFEEQLKNELCNYLKILYSLFSVIICTFKKFFGSFWLLTLHNIYNIFDNSNRGQDCLNRCAE